MTEYFERFSRWKAIVAFLTILLTASIVAATAIGSVEISPVAVAKILLSKLPILGPQINQTWTHIDEIIIIQIRLPRILLAMLVGSALAVAGATMQGLFKNPMADPYVMGISSGAALGATIAVIAGKGGIYGLPLLAFLGATSAVFLVYKIAWIEGKAPLENLLLSGIAVAIFFSSVASFLMYLAGENLHQIVFWLMGGFWARDWGHVAVSFLPIFVGTLGIYLFARDLNVMLLGEEPAEHLGIEVENIKKILLVLSALITGVAVSVSGIIGFVGLIIPHAIRIMVGPDHRVLIPSCAIFGAIFLIWADTLARTLISPAELPVGIITAFFGAPFFIYLLRTKKKVP